MILKPDLEAEFHREMESIYIQARDECGYRATYFLQLVQELGGLATARQLLAPPGISEGLAKLAELGRLDLSMEALVLKAPWCGMFSDEELKNARRKLK